MGNAWYLKMDKDIGILNVIYSHLYSGADFFNPWSSLYEELGGETDYIEFLETGMSNDEADILLFSAADRQTVQLSLDQLPVKYKEVLTLYYLEEMLYKDIADSLDIPIGTVMSRLTRAREGLKISLLKQMNPKMTLNFKKPLIPA